MSFSFNYTWDYYPLVPFIHYSPLTPADSVSDDIIVRFYPIWFKQITIEWAIPATWGSCRFNIYRSNTSDPSNYDKINAEPLTTTFIKDITSTQYSKFGNDFYIVEVVLPSGKRVRSTPRTWQNTRNRFAQLRALEVQRREFILLSKFTGVNSYVFRVKTYGQRCKTCWNFQLEKVMNDRCTDCMGTSFQGGYWNAIQTYVQYDPSPNDLSMEYFGKFETNELSAWTISFPELKARDLIFRQPDSALFYISDWVSTELQTAPVRQILKLVQLDKTSPEYAVIIANNLIPSQYQT